MSRKAIIIELVPVLHDHGWTQRQIAEALGVCHQYVAELLHELGIIPRRPRDMVEAIARLDAETIVLLRSLANV